MVYCCTCSHSTTHTRTHTQTQTPLGRTPLDEGLACRCDLNLKTDNVRNRKTPVPPAGLKPTIPATEDPADPRLRPRSHPDRQQRISLRDFVVILYLISLIFIQSPHPFLRNASIHVSSSLWTVINQDWPTYDATGTVETSCFKFVCAGFKFPPCIMIVNHFY